MESTRKGSVVKRRKYEREGKKGTINIVLKSGWNQIVEQRQRKFQKKGKSRKRRQKFHQAKVHNHD